MMNPKSILISGYYGFENSGDEAVLAAIVQLLQAQLPHAKLVALSAQPEKTKAAYGILAIDRKNRGQIKTALQSAALLISGGGSLFQDVTSVGSVLYYSSILQLAHKGGVPAIVLAQGLGPLNTGMGKWLTKRALKNCAFLSWRDQESLDLAIHLGLPKTKQLLTCDPVLLWQPHSFPTAKAAPLANPKAGKSIVVALRPWQGLALEEMAKTIEILLAQGHRVALLPFHKGVDEAIALKLNSLLAQPVQILATQGPTADYEAIEKADFLLGMRLHALIMAVAAGTSAAALSYDPKIDSFAKFAGLPVLGTAASLRAEFLGQQILDLLNHPPKRMDQAALSALWQEPLAKIKALYEQGQL